MSCVRSFEPIEKPSKISANSARQDHVRRDLAHHVDLEPVLAAPQAVLRHQLHHPAALLRRPAERDHQLEVRQAHVVAHPPHRPALEGERLAVARVRVAVGAAEPEHRVLLHRLEVAAAEQVRRTRWT